MKIISLPWSIFLVLYETQRACAHHYAQVFRGPLNFYAEPQNLSLCCRNELSRGIWVVRGNLSNFWNYPSKFSTSNSSKNSSVVHYSRSLNVKAACHHSSPGCGKWCIQLAGKPQWLTHWRTKMKWMNNWRVNRYNADNLNNPPTIHLNQQLPCKGHTTTPLFMLHVTTYKHIIHVRSSAAVKTLCVSRQNDKFQQWKIK